MPAGKKPLPTCSSLFAIVVVVSSVMYCHKWQVMLEYTMPCPFIPKMVTPGLSPRPPCRTSATHLRPPGPCNESLISRHICATKAMRKYLNTSALVLRPPGPCDESLKSTHIGATKPMRKYLKTMTN